MNTLKLVIVIAGSACGAMLVASSIYCYVTERMPATNQLLGSAGSLVVVAIVLGFLGFFDKD